MGRRAAGGLLASADGAAAAGGGGLLEVGGLLRDEGGDRVLGTSLKRPEDLTSRERVSLKAAMNFWASPAPRKSGMAMAGMPASLETLMVASCPVRIHRAPDSAMAKPEELFHAWVLYCFS